LISIELFMFFLFIFKLNHIVGSLLANVHREARAAARSQTKNTRHILTLFFNVINVFLDASVWSHNISLNFIFLREGVSLVSDHVVECKNASGLTKVNHLENVWFSWKLREIGTTNRRLFDVISNNMSILIHRHNRLDFVHWSQTDISKTEDAIIDGRIWRLTFLDQWVLVGYLTFAVDEDLTSFLVKAFC